MPRIPYPDRQELPTDLGAYLDQLPPHAAFDMLSHSPATIKNFLKQAGAQFTRLELSPRNRELTILTTASAIDCAYEFVQHVPISESVGVSATEREAIRRKEFGSPELSEEDRALIGFVAAVVAGPTVPDKIFAPVNERFSPREILEVMQVTGYYWSFGRVCTVLEVEVEADHGNAVIEVSRRLHDAAT